MHIAETWEDQFPDRLPFGKNSLFITRGILAVVPAKSLDSRKTDRRSTDLFHHSVHNCLHPLCWTDDLFVERPINQQHIVRLQLTLYKAYPSSQNPVVAPLAGRKLVR